MRLVEKKCPNCGAGISFDANATEVTCKYCNTCFEIERDNDINDLSDNLKNIDFDSFSLHAKVVKKISTVIFIVWAIVFVSIFILFFIMFFRNASMIF
ncbi:MAG: hypothetical protein IJ568_02380 [Bacilli bacterium]|nr:hypothetical protein [Bacilli bacterium]